MKSENARVLILLVVTIIVTYFTPMPLLGFNIKNVRYNTNKLYNVMYIAVIVTLTDIILNKEHFTTNSFVIWLFILILFTIFIYYLIEEQKFIDNEQYLLAMIENHEVDIEMSEKILNNNEINSKTREIVLDIIKNRNNELNSINTLLASNTL